MVLASYVLAMQETAVNHIGQSCWEYLSVALSFNMAVLFHEGSFFELCSKTIWWCHHDLEMHSALLWEIHESSVDFQHKGPIIWTFDIFFVVSLNNLLHKV